MLQNILDLEGARELQKQEQQSIKGGAACSRICANPSSYPPYQHTQCCVQGYCDPNTCD